MKKTIYTFLAIIAFNAFAIEDTADIAEEKIVPEQEQTAEITVENDSVAEIEIEEENIVE